MAGPCSYFSISIKKNKIDNISLPFPLKEMPFYKFGGEIWCMPHFFIKENAFYKFPIIFSYEYYMFNSYFGISFLRRHYDIKICMNLCNSMQNVYMKLIIESNVQMFECVF